MGGSENRGAPRHPFSPGARPLGRAVAHTMIGLCVRAAVLLLVLIRQAPNLPLRELGRACGLFTFCLK